MNEKTTRECVHTRGRCHHENSKCSECPLTELICDEFYKAKDAYASGLKAVREDILNDED